MLTITLNSPEELAAFSMDKSAVILVVGTRESSESVFEQVAALANSSEHVVHLENDSKLFNSMERPTSTPAIGVWSSKGSLVGYREADESIEDFLAYAREYF